MVTKQVSATAGRGGAMLWALGTVALLAASWLALPGTAQYEPLEGVVGESGKWHRFAELLANAPPGSGIPGTYDGMGCVPSDLPIPTTRAVAEAVVAPHIQAALRGAQRSSGSDMYAYRWRANCLESIPGGLLDRAAVEQQARIAGGRLQVHIESVQGRRVASLVISVLSVVAAALALRGAARSLIVDPIAGPSPVRSGAVMAGVVVACGAVVSLAMVPLPWLRPVPSIGQLFGSSWIVAPLFFVGACTGSAALLALTWRGLRRSVSKMDATDPELAGPRAATARHARMLADIETARRQLAEKEQYVAVLARNGAPQDLIARENVFIEELRASASRVGASNEGRAGELVTQIATKRTERQALISNGAPEDVVRLCEDAIHALRKALASESAGG